MCQLEANISSTRAF